MALNVTLSEWTLQQFVLSVILFFERAAMTASNGLLFSVLLHRRVLRERKQYLVVAWAALADLLYGLTGVAGSFQQFYYRLTPQPDTVLSSQCPVQLKLINLAAMVAQQLTLTGQCIDRLLAVSTPFLYFSLTTKYAKRMLFTIYGIVLFYFLSAQIGVAVMPVTRVSDCISSVAVHWLVWLLFAILLIFPSVSILCMQPALYMQYKRSFNKTYATSTSARQQQNYLVQQRRLTVTVALTAAAAIFTVLVPVALTMPVLYVMPKGSLPGVGLLLLACYNFGPMSNLAIYCVRQSEVRVGLLKMFKGEQLPNNFENR